jgi:hypothetical protein
MVAAPKSWLPVEVAKEGIASCAERVPANMRLVSLRKKWVIALREHGGVWNQAPIQRL